MKKDHWLFKLITAVLLIGTAACAVAVFWDKLVDAFYTICDRIEERMADRVAVSSEYDDYDDSALMDE